VGKILRITWIPVVLVLLYSGWLVWERHQSAAFRRPVPAEGPDPYGAEFKILDFSTHSGAISPGEKALVCYGVLNAISVRLDPPVENVWPSLSRCFEVSPTKTTRYTLTAESADHHEVTGSVEVSVK
jgi:hypothetical protein